jgi:hypothetical protein
MKIDLSDVPATLSGDALRQRALARFRTLNTVDEQPDSAHRCTEKALLQTLAQNSLDTSVFLSNGGLTDAMGTAMKKHAPMQDRMLPEVKIGKVIIRGYKVRDAILLLAAIAILATGIGVAYLSVRTEDAKFIARVQQAMWGVSMDDLHKETGK